MRILLPTTATNIVVPTEWQQSTVQSGIVHYDLWAQSSKPGDVCVASQLQPAEVVDFTLNHKAKNLVQFNSSWFKEDVEMALQIAKSPANYFKSPVQAVLNSPDKSECLKKEWLFRDGTQKEAILDEVYQKLPVETEILKESVRAVFEELFMNAVLDAPRESLRTGQEKYGYEKRPPAKMSFGYDDTRLALACSDPYGTLDINRFLSRMSEVYKQGAGQVVNLVRDKGGAGLGCVILFEHSSALFLGVDAGKMTTVTCQIPMTMSHRQRASVPKSLHILEGV